MMAAAPWDVLAKVANLAQLSGVHAVMLLAVGLSLLRIPQCMRERAELERCARRLRALLRPGPAIAGGCEIMPLHPVMEGLVLMALRDADSLIGSYDGSTLWRLLRSGRTMADQLRDVHGRVDSCCLLVLFAHAYILTQAIPFPRSDVATSHQGNDGPPAAIVAETSAAAAAHQRANDIDWDQGLDDQTDDTDSGYEIVTAILISDE